MKQLTFLVLMMCSLLAKSQVKIGTNPSSINSNAILEMQTTNKGLLLPRVALTAVNSALPLTAFTAGMAIYNTATAGSGNTAVTPGYYFSDGTRWVRLQDAVTTDVREPWRNAVTITPADSNSTNIVFNKGNIGINTGIALPGAKLDVNGTLKIKDGTEANGRTLVSDANGLAHWVASAGTTVSAGATLSVNGVSVNGSGTAVATGSYIDLAPGKWLVNVVMLASNGSNQVPSGQGIWIRSSLSNTAGGTTVSADIIGSWLVSGSLTYPMRYGLVSGILFVNNTSATTKRYYYYAYGESLPGTPAAFAVTNFGSSQWGEDQVYAVPIN